MNSQNIKKKNLINSLFNNIGFPKTVCENIVSETFNLIKKNLIKNESIKISKFGTFTKKFKKERLGRNPKTKEDKKISSRYVVVFKPSKEFINKINL
jgi:integration host factor subunit alpha|tara:strand:+ start:448 stop:738 length:291 start_codon:yes stop_codon:yes gene_type:complete